ncbi:copper chaperone PCu(A)C [Leucobacter allii]|uniref:copper chaperone PCu(A)C n=1 Tax=Leucobacter allii TaxID=2932247 RepID=UPI001FD4B7BC|nr:copper chaperone PCu(A)C [Leucobacter allii]UOR02842.1 copper chaperone PCu(A)C [Leucobacter allii]
MRTVAALAAPALAIALLAGCASPSDAPAGAAASAETSGSAAATAEGVALSGGWAKAGEGMTGVFGTLENAGEAPVVLERVESPAAGMIELHETVTSGSSSTMREVDGGFEIPAGGSVELAPGGDHIMFMDMPKALLAGDEVPLTLVFDDGSTLEVSVLAKDYAGAEENYESGAPGDDAHAGH